MVSWCTENEEIQINFYTMHQHIADSNYKVPFPKKGPAETLLQFFLWTCAETFLDMKMSMLKKYSKMFADTFSFNLQITAEMFSKSFRELIEMYWCQEQDCVETIIYLFCDRHCLNFLTGFQIELVFIFLLMSNPQAKRFL